jgi:hypothetical protein
VKVNGILCCLESTEPSIFIELMRSIMMSNPQIRAMVEQNPEIGHVINDPSFLRQSMQMMRLDTVLV